MTPERWQQIKAVFEAVDSAAPADRPALLEQLCKGDSALSGEVRIFLQGEDDGTYFHGLVGDAAVGFAYPDHDLTGRVLGQYSIISLLGSGGMGEVYAADDSRLGRQVALKLLASSYARDANSIKRFQQEARSASALNHPNIVTVYDFGQIDAQYYLVTELVQGKTLRTLVEGKLTLNQTLNIGVQIAGALAAAHEAGIVHRDIKPENIMVRPDGYVKVLDFGLAKLRERDGAGDGAPSNLTVTGAVMGTMAYMSPEQARGLPLDGRSDIFSLGIMLYEMASGQTPFQGKTGADLIAALLSSDPKPLTTFVPSAPDALSAILDKCLRKDREQRYQSTQELLDDLRRIQQDIDSGARLATTLDRGKSRKLKLLAGAVVAAAAAFALALALYPKPHWYRNIRLTKSPGMGSISPSGRYYIGPTDFSDGTQSVSVRLSSAAGWVEVVPRSAFRHYAYVFSPDENYVYYTEDIPGDSSSRNSLFRVPTLGGSRQKLMQDINGIAFSRDGSKFAFQRARPGVRSLWVADPDGSNPYQLLESRTAWPLRAVGWSHDGKEIFYTEGSQTSAGIAWRFYAVSRAGGPSRLIRELGKVQIVGFAALPDASGFIANAYDPESNLPQIWLLSRTGEMSRITHDFGEYQGISMTLDGKKVATTQADRHSEIWVIDAKDPSTARRITDTTRRFGEPVWTQGAGIVGTLNISGVSSLWGLTPDGLGNHPFPAAGSLSQTEPAACPGRDEIVFASRANGATNIWRAHADGSEFKQLTFGPSDRYPQCLADGTVVYRSLVGDKYQTAMAPIDGGDPKVMNDAAWQQPVSPDGKFKLVYYTDEKKHESRAAIQTRDGTKTLTSFPSDGPAAWEPNGRSVAMVARRDKFQEIWRQPVDGSAPRQLTHFGGKAFFALNWSPDGRYIVCAIGAFTVDSVQIEDVK